MRTSHRCLTCNYGAFAAGAGLERPKRLSMHRLMIIASCAGMLAAGMPYCRTSSIAAHGRAQRCLRRQLAQHQCPAAMAAHLKRWPGYHSIRLLTPVGSGTRSRAPRGYCCFDPPLLGPVLRAATPHDQIMTGSGFAILPSIPSHERNKPGGKRTQAHEARMPAGTTRCVHWLVRAVL